MTKILLITNKDDITTDFIVKGLSKRNITFFRFNTEDFISRIAVNLDIDNGSYNLINENGQIIDLSKVRSVYYRRPSIPMVSIGNLSHVEQQYVTGEMIYTLEGIYKILRNAFWISWVDSIRIAENKIYQLQLAKEIGFTLPSSLITNVQLPAESFNKNRETIIKPIKTGLLEDGEQGKVIFTSKVRDFEAVSDRVKSCVTYFQEFINKSADIRVTVVGDKVFPALIESQSHESTQVDWRMGVDIKLEYKRINLPSYIEEYCLQLTKTLGLNFSAIDLVVDHHGNFIFLEINPNGQWAWIENQLGYEISNEIINLLNR